MRITRIHPWMLTVFVLAGVILLGNGCTADKKVGNQVRGSVTVAGTPLKSGSIAFEPDSQRGNTGPVAITPIVDGKYETDPQRGVGQGPYVVRISPPDFESGSDVSAVLMKKPFTTSVQLEAGKTTYDFDVPKP